MYHLPLLRIYIPSTYVVFRFVAAGQLYITTASIAALTYGNLPWDHSWKKGPRNDTILNLGEPNLTKWACLELRGLIF